MHQAILTFAAFCTFIEGLLTERKFEYGKDDSYKTTRDNVLYFVSRRRAEEADAGMNRRELANMFMEGLPPMDEANVEQWLADFYIDIDNTDNEVEKQAYIETNNKLLRLLVLEYYGLLTTDEHVELNTFGHEGSDTD